MDAISANRTTFAIRSEYPGDCLPKAKEFGAPFGIPVLINETPTLAGFDRWPEQSTRSVLPK